MSINTEGAGIALFPVPEIYRSKACEALRTEWNDVDYSNLEIVATLLFFCSTASLKGRRIPQSSEYQHQS
jgi:hypothetical protein